ncbi:hypothetical protein [Leifsonia sp. Le1]|uniref:hypothetical protein n=1 Tax=Leifsonia sp. Le1 TaxID=3404918 RepID=UPI003EBA2903
MSDEGEAAEVIEVPQAAGATGVTEIVEAWASESTLLAFDGRILEVFGFPDVQRIHIAFRPTITVGKKMVSIAPTQGGKLSFFYDAARADEIAAFAVHVHAAHAAHA